MKLKFIAATAALLMAGSAQAAVVTFTTPIAVPNNFDGVYINFLTGATGITASSVPGWDFNPYATAAGLSFFWSATPTAGGGVASSTTGPYLNLAPGAVVSSASTFAAVTATTATAAFQTTGTHILGFRFYNEATSAVNYGYLTMTNTASTGFPATITSWSFENTGAAITVGGASAAVPEPATWGMMILGFGMIGAAARSRKVRTTVKFA